MMTEQTPMNMARITELMRSGDLAQATQMIQSGLGGGAMPRMPTGGLSMPQMPKMPQMPQMPQMPTGFPTGTTARGGAPVDLPDGATWTTHQHQAAGQSREYRLYLPASLDGRPAAGLLLLLHGCTQDPDDFARGTGIMAAAERHRVIVVAPAQTAQANMNRCWNWFEARHTARDGGEAAFLVDLTRSVAHDHAVAPEQRFAAGLSAGGAMAVILGAVFADDFGAVACHSGLPNGAATDMGGAFQAMSQGGSDRGQGVGCRLFVVHGTTDKTVSPRNADAVLDQALRRQPGLTRRAADAKLNDRAVHIGRYRDDAGRLRIETWRVDGLAHAWSGGAPTGSYTAPGPQATDAMMAFFLG